MLNGLFSVTESAMASLMSILKFHINDYCDLETTDGSAFVAKDGSMGTMLRYSGFRSLVGADEYKQFSRDVAASLEQFLDQRGHMMQVVFYRDDDADHKISRLLEPSYDTCRRMQLDLLDLLDEKKAVAKHYCMDEDVFVILWTRPAIMDPMEVKLSVAERQEMIEKYKVPAISQAQNIARPIRFLIDRHDAFVSKFVNDVTRLNGSVQVIPIHEALCELKRYLHKNTPYSWRPVLNGGYGTEKGEQAENGIIGLWKNNSKKRDFSEFLPHRIDQQLFSTPAHIGKSKSEDGVTDLRAVRLGTRLFAPVNIKIPQQRLRSFTHLFSQLNDSASKRSDGVNRPLPWSISFLVEGDGLRGIALRKILAGMLGWSSAESKNLNKAAEALNRYRLHENGCVIKLQISAVTWADYDQEKELMRRRNKLSSALQGWGNCVVEEETGDPIEVLMSTAPGMRLTSSATSAAAPLDWITYMLPFSRPSSTFERGNTLFRTLDHKVLPWEIFSSQQNTWVTAVFGGPGSGKSVWANSRNCEMCFMPGLTRLPYICVIDIGVSSSGFISMVRDALPNEKKHQALYLRLQNTEAYRINQFDTQLGQRKPLPREREMMKYFLVRIATSPEKGRAHAYANEFAGFIIDTVFKKLSDQDDHGKPREFHLESNEIVRNKVLELGIQFHEATTWWQIVDALFERGYIYEASVAQRYAQPTLFDILNTVSSQDAQHFRTAIDDNASVIDVFKLLIQSAMSEYPIFSGETVYDIGESRVMSIDLNDVISKGSADAKKKTSLMYMVALNSFLKKVSLIEEDLPEINDKYKAHHTQRVKELAEDHKRLFCDEYHHTGADPLLRESFLTFGRESRKWQLEIILCSQLPGDFASLADIATTTIILDAGNESTRSQIVDIFGLSPTEVAALKRYVNGPTPGIGGTFLAKIKTKTAELSQLYTSTVGGIEMWGLSTTAEDRALRNALYKRIPSPEARKLLCHHFPSGTCKDYVARKKAESASERSDGFVDDDEMKSIIEMLTERLLSDWDANRDRYTV